MRTDPLSDILGRLECVKGSNGEFTARCPAHEDHNPSLSIKRGDDKRVLLHCHAGCTADEITAALGISMSALFTTNTAAFQTASTKNGSMKRGGKTYPTLDSAIAAACRMVRGEHAGTWAYQRGDGCDVLHVARFSLPNGGKEFRPFHHNGTGYAMSDPPGMLPLYRLADLSGQQLIYIVEGEKCADAASAIGLPVTTSAHGSKSAAKTDWSPLAGREVVILPDADDPGFRYADSVAGILDRLDPPATVRILRLPGLTIGGDIWEFIEDRRTDAKDDLAIRTEIKDLAALVPEHEPSTDEGPDDAPRPVLVRLSDVQPEEVCWLWPGRIALGKVTMIAGDPGLGKSFITLDMTARVSTGTPWPDVQDQPNPAGGIVLLNAEDDVADTIRPRLDAAGADVSRITALQAIRQDGDQRQFNLATDLAALERAINVCDKCRLVVIDPITAYLGKTDSHKNADIRGLLAPLAELASRFRVAILVVSHLNKSSGGPAIYRTMGSLAFVAAARAVWSVTKDPDDPTRRLMLPVKNNLAPDTGGLAYSLNCNTGKTPYIAWEADPVMITADEALQESVGVGEPSERHAAEEWIREALADGPMASVDVLREAKENGISEKTLKRAKQAIGVKARRQGFGKGASWNWVLPGTHHPPAIEHSGPSNPIEGQAQDVPPNGSGGPLCTEHVEHDHKDSTRLSEKTTLQ